MVTAGYYRIGWALNIASSKNEKTSSYRATIDASGVDASLYILDEFDVRTNTGGTYSNWAGFQHLQITDGSHAINIDYLTDGDAGNVASITNVRLEFFRARQEV